MKAVIPAIVLLLSAVPSFAQRSEPLPQELEGVGITEHLNETIPLDIGFLDEDGNQVTLGKYFNQGRPVVLTLVYFSCPMLCTLVLNGLIDAMQGISLVPGKDFDLVTVSFDPRETPRLANLKRQNYLNEYGKEGAGAGWHFLTGNPESIKRLTDAIGFRYRWDEENQQYAHAAGLMILTPEGRLSRYLFGVQFEPRPLRFALIEAGQGKVGSPIDQALFYCYHYDSKSGSYTIAAMRIMRIAGLLTLVIVLAWLGTNWFRSARHRKVAPVAQG